LLRSECVDQQNVGLGLNNIIAIAMPDAVLIAQKNMVQDVTKIVDHLKLKISSRQKVIQKILDLEVGLKVLSLMIAFRSNAFLLSQEQRLAFKVISIVLNIG